MVKVFPTIIIGLSVLAGVGYATQYNWRKALYWFFAAGLNLVVTY